MKEMEIFQAALETWGANAQTLMVFEEMAELQKALCKNARRKDNRESIAEEIADVQIMLEQMIVLHDCRAMVMTNKAAKIKRLQERLGLGEAMQK